jgi:uncharacterized radical SAM superfamily Fe-S cluster-containing enzyme
MDRESTFADLTRSICPVCSTLIDAQILIREGKVFMRKRCREHGWFESIISSDVNLYTNAFKFNKPGTIPLKFATEVRDGCPYDCGLCPEHQQHSCVGIIEVTENCNLRCPTCFSDSSVGRSLSLDQVRFMLDKFVEYEENPEVIQFSGGEPTIHPEILEMLAEARKRSFKYVMINTNGIRIARDEEFVKALKKMGIYVYLQFDGFKPETFRTLRGENLNETKKQALERLSEYDVKTVLVSTVQRNVNEDEYGAIVDFALNQSFIKGVVFQPTFYSGRHPHFNPLDRVTLADVAKGIAEQSRYGFRVSDFVTIPCCYPNCSTATYVYFEDGKATPLTRLVDVEEYLDYISNRSVADLDFITKRSELEALYSAGSIPGSGKVLENYCNVCGLSIDLKELEDKVTMILIQPFMDAWNFDLKRVMKCCVSEILPDGRLIPFCAYNNIYRGIV